MSEPMPDTPRPADADALRRWPDDQAGAFIRASGDAVTIRQWLAHAIGDDSALARLRGAASALSDGTDVSRLDNYQLIDYLTTAVAEGRLRTTGIRRDLSRSTSTGGQAPAPPPPPSSLAASRPAAPVEPPPVVETTFGSELNVPAMVAVLVQSAQNGVPFCEECARAAAAREAAREAA